VAGEPLESFIVGYLERSTVRICATDLIRRCVRERCVGRATVQAALRRLADAGRIQYTNLFGATQVSLAWSRPHWVSPRIMLAPPETGSSPPAKKGAVVLRIAGGAAFGAGDHPTTRLALQALDAMFAENRIVPGTKVLDVGTGTGVLAIGAVRLGADEALALDIDPNALWEARANVVLNGLADCIRVCADPVEDLVGSFDLVLANLRLPSLLRLTPVFSRLLSEEGAAVVSGIRPEEAAELFERWSGLGLTPCWIKERQGWMGAGFCRGSTTG